MPVTAAMIARFAETQNRDAAEYAELEGTAFDAVPALTECGETSLRTDVPSQAPVLPLTTTPAGVILAAEVAKHNFAPEAQLANWLFGTAEYDRARTTVTPHARDRRLSRCVPPELSLGAAAAL